MSYETPKKHNIVQQAEADLRKISELADHGQIAWRDETPPAAANAMRAFWGITEAYQIMVCQANIKENPKDANEQPHIVHEAMAVCLNAGLSMIRMPPELADKLYHQAAAQRN